MTNRQIKSPTHTHRHTHHCMLSQGLRKWTYHQSTNKPHPLSHENHTHSHTLQEYHTWLQHPTGTMRHNGINFSKRTQLRGLGEMKTPHSTTIPCHAPNNIAVSTIEVRTEVCQKKPWSPLLWSGSTKRSHPWNKDISIRNFPKGVHYDDFSHTD